VTYCGDWNNDDQPYPMKVKAGKLFSIPYCMEINDIPLYVRKGYTGEQYYRSVIDQFEALYADSAKQPRVMGIPLHPMISGQPLRIKYLQRVIAEMRSHERSGLPPAAKSSMPTRRWRDEIRNRPIPFHQNDPKTDPDLPLSMAHAHRREHALLCGSRDAGLPAPSHHASRISQGS
jgi:hypothetical protein